jgi:hypothetical protein
MDWAAERSVRMTVREIDAADVRDIVTKDSPDYHAGLGGNMGRSTQIKGGGTCCRGLLSAFS